MRIVVASTALVALLACSRPQSESTPAQKPPASSAQTTPSSAAPTTESPSPAAPPTAAGTAPSGAVATKAAGPRRDGCDGLFDPPEGAVKLCNEHMVGSGAEIHWTSWAVTSARADTFRPYERSAAACGASTTSAPLPSLSKADSRLTVHDAQETGYPSCATKPGSTHASVVVISVQQRRQ
jgi:hypothetical protein